MRFRTLILMSGILLLHQSLLFAIPEAEKAQILASEWERIEKPKEETLKAIEDRPVTSIKKEVENRKPILPEAFDRTITLRAK